MNINLSMYSKDPLYEQIIKEIKRNILNNEVVSGEQMPSIRQLAKDLEVSVITVKKAYDSLESENYITTIPGKGTYVAELDTSKIRAKKIVKIEQELKQLVDEAKSIQLSESELINLINKAFKEEENG
ncbi:GntR family transcriptional regulator [Fundicoccus culcitae]|uniref:GntR family transcriptional regulator n=1 Tax=Fundicoccus culcitae TaxID=2969821 RepID=A0ABY5P7L6_9LACT|nr:GntR family transcriptional regulator [Fundicoccus culcitae]UUX34727.1 GntR family transcriptional regulator [Fundicoccus culcitae]